MLAGYSGIYGKGNGWNERLRSVFIPWYIDPDYVNQYPNFERTPDEDEIAAKYNLTDGQLMFRRRKIAQNGYDLFRQEFPSEPDEAFLTTGRPVFNPEQLQDCFPG